MGTLRFGLVICTLLATLDMGAQQPQAPTVLVLSLRPSLGNDGFVVGLKNEGPTPVHVLLGYGDGRGHHCLDSISVRLTSAEGKTFEMVPIGFPIAGVVQVLEKVIPPHQEWTAEVFLKDFMGDEVGKPLTNPKLVKMLRRGSYQVQAVFKSESSFWPQNQLRYRTGSLQSNLVGYLLR
jgi:hypothetical protein